MDKEATLLARVAQLEGLMGERIDAHDRLQVQLNHERARIDRVLGEELDEPKASTMAPPPYDIRSR